MTNEEGHTSTGYQYCHQGALTVLVTWRVFSSDGDVETVKNSSSDVETVKNSSSSEVSVSIGF